MSPMFVLGQGSHTFAMFYAHVIKEISIMHAHITVTTFTRFDQNYCMEYTCIVWLNYAIKPHLYACSYTIWPERAMEVIWRIFLLSVSAPSLHTK